MKRNAVVVVGILLIMSLVTSFSFFGCKTTETTQAAETTAAEETTELEWVNTTLYPSLKVPVVPDKKIYYVESFLGDVAHRMMVSGAESVFKDMQVQFEVLNPENDLQRQVKMIDDIIAKGDADALILSAIDSEGISSSVEKCNEAGIPVFIIDRWSTGGQVEFGVGGDWYTHGTTATNNLVELLKEKYDGEAKGTVIAMIIGMEINALRDRAAALRDVMKQYPDIKIIEKQGDFDANKDAKILQDALTANPETDAVWNIADVFGQSFVPALEEMGRLYKAGDPNHLIIQSMDGTDWALQAIRDGYFDATVSSFVVEWGFMAAWAAGQKLGDMADFSGELNVEGAAWSGKYFDMGNGTFLGLTSILVTKDNVDDKSLWGNRVSEFLE